MLLEWSKDGFINLTNIETKELIKLKTKVDKHKESLVDVIAQGSDEPEFIITKVNCNLID